VNVNFRPYYSEGSKAAASRSSSSSGWKTPAHIIVPCAGGSLITKIYKAIKELKTLGLIEGDRGTKMYAAQALGCGPIVTMIKNDTDVLVPVREHDREVAGDRQPADGYYAYKVAKDSGGSGEHATDEEIVEGMLLLARTEGIFTETAGGVTVAATKS
jgi:threonine synthase